MHCGRDRSPHHEIGFAFLTLASVALTLPFICYAKDIAKSVKIIAGRTTLDDGKC